MPHDVVISYSRRNREIADRLAALLRERGLHVWYDRMIPAGADWRDEIARAIAGAKSLAILFSQESNDSDELKKELAIADRRGLLIFPVRIENVEPLGLFEYELARRQWFDAFNDWQGDLPQVADGIAEGLRGRDAKSSSEVEPRASLHASAADTFPSIAPQQAGRWRHLSLYAANLFLGVVPFYIPIWLIVQIFMTRFAGRDRPRAEFALGFAYTTALVGAVSAIALVIPVESFAVIKGAAIIQIVVAAVMTSILAVDYFLRKRHRAAFWVIPILGAITVASGFIGMADAYEHYESIRSWHDRDYVTEANYLARAISYWPLLSLGMTLANAAYFVEAWKRSRPRPVQSAP